MHNNLKNGRIGKHKHETGMVWDRLRMYDFRGWVLRGEREEKDDILHAEIVA